MKKLIFVPIMAFLTLWVNAAEPSRPASDRSYIEQTFAQAVHQRDLADNATFMQKLEKAVNKADADAAAIIANHSTFLFLNGMLEQVGSSIERMPKQVLASEDGQKALDAYNSVRMVDVGTKVPDFTLPTPDGKTLNFYTFLKGKKCVILDFWASWCGWCRKENPSVKAAYDAYKDKGADVLSVSLDEKEPAWRKALNEDKPTWPQAWEKRGTKAGLYKWFNLNGIPAIFLISNDGTIVAKGLRGDKISEAIQNYLNKN
jgi:peroxiredoxin